MKVVLEGGGSLGAFEVGVLKQLWGKGLLDNVDEYLGSSTGILQACGMGFLGMENLKNTWLGIKSTNDIYKSKDDLPIPVNAILDGLGGIAPGWLNSAPLAAIIDKMVVSRPNATITGCRVSEVTGEKNFFSAHPDGTFTNVADLTEFKKGVLASASTPGIVDLVDGEWADGGLRDITPIDAAIDHGGTDIIAILTQPYAENIIFQGKPVGLLNTVGRAFAVIMQQAFWNATNAGKGIPGVKVTIYAPQQNLGDAFQFQPALISAWMQQGENAIPFSI